MSRAGIARRPYAKANGGICPYQSISSRLDLDAASSVVVALRRLGYAVTVPLDVATAPLFMCVVLLGGASDMH